MGFMIPNPAVSGQHNPTQPQAVVQQQSTEQQQQAPQQGATSSAQESVQKTKKKKNRSKNQKAKAWTKRKLADTLKATEKLLKDEQEKSAKLQSRLDAAESMDQSEQEGSNSAGTNSSDPASNTNNQPPAQNSTADTSAQSSSTTDNNSKSPSRSNTGFTRPLPKNMPATPANHGTVPETPARGELANVISNVHLATPKNDSASVSGSTSSQAQSTEAITEGGQGNVLRGQISPLPPSVDTSSPNFIANLHKNSEILKDVNARYCSLQIKAKLDFDSNAHYTCPRCKENIPYYRANEKIPILITTSTLGRTHKEAFEKDGVCTHFEVFEFPGGKINEISVVMTPILDFLSQYNSLNLLIVMGVNDFCNKKQQYEDIVVNLEHFQEYIKCNNKITAKFIEIPLVPSLSLLKLDSHVVRSDKTEEILKYNDELTKWNAASIPRNVKVPSLARAGIRKESPGVFPKDHSHVPELWANWDKYIKDKNCIHLADHVKRAFWGEIKEYFFLDTPI